jgi:hypothetical protein
LLCYFRSQHTNQSWLSALTAILDASALLISGIRGPEARQAQLTFAMARHAMVDLVQIFGLQPVKDGTADRLSPETYQRLFDLLCKSGINVCQDNLSHARLNEMRQLYEGYAEALSRYLAMPLPPWVADEPHKDNWQTVARLRERAEAAGVPPEQAAEIARRAADRIEHHDF